MACRDFHEFPDWASEDWDLITLPIRRGEFQLQRTLKGKVVGMECSPRDAHVLSYMISVSWPMFYLLKYRRIEDKTVR